MKNLKKIVLWVLVTAMVLSLAACGGDNQEEQPAEPEETAAAESAAPAEEPAEEAETEYEKTDINIAALKGPTALGMLQMMDMAEKGEAPDNYNFTLAGAPDEIVGNIVKGEFDIAAIPANLASVLYNKTEGKVQLLALNTLGVLYVVENGESINSVADLAGRTLYNLGKGATPEYVLNYILTNNGIDPEKDIDVQYKSEPGEVAALMAQEQAAAAVLPQPFVTALMAKNPNVRVALDFNEEWRKIDESSTITMGCVIVQKAFAEENPEAVQRFLEAYEASVGFTNNEATLAEAAEIAGAHEILPAPIAEKAIPQCNIVFKTGDEMKNITAAFLQVLFDANPASVGGKLPGEDFYFNAQ